VSGGKIKSNQHTQTRERHEKLYVYLFVVFIRISELFPSQLILSNSTCAKPTDAMTFLTSEISTQLAAELNALRKIIIMGKYI
jgi:hypothetical protein